MKSGTGFRMYQATSWFQGRYWPSCSGIVRSKCVPTFSVKVDVCRIAHACVDRAAFIRAHAVEHWENLLRKHLERCRWRQVLPKTWNAERRIAQCIANGFQVHVDKAKGCRWQSLHRFRLLPRDLEVLYLNNPFVPSTRVFNGESRTISPSALLGSALRRSDYMIST